jgi:hypothetical protein
MKRMFLWNGTATGANIDLGIYSRDGARVCSTGSVAQSGASVPQYINLSYLLPPGSYYFALGASSTSGSFLRYSYGAIGTVVGRAFGYVMQPTTFPLPAVMSPAAATIANVPVMGMTLTESGF